MPIQNSRDIIPFVNDLESKLKQVQNDLKSWNDEKTKILNAIPQVERNRVSSISAIVKAEDALAEINTATFGVVAVKGQRLKKLLEDLKNQVLIIAQNAKGVGVEQYIKDEINNAISEVDSAVQDGLKLDYRIRKVQEIAQEGMDFANKEIVLPLSYAVATPLNADFIQLPEPQEGVVFVKGDVTVLDEKGQTAVLGTNGEAIYGHIDETGLISLTEAPGVPVKLYYPVKFAFKDVPEDFLFYMLQTIVSKTSPIMVFLKKIEAVITEVVTDIRYMKGQDWTVDHSIMRNHKDIVKESITPKGLMTSIQNGMVHATFSYNDHPHLSHFILEKLDPVTNEWKPFDGDKGFISK
jgi:hypothetical protein